VKSEIFAYPPPSVFPVNPPTKKAGSLIRTFDPGVLMMLAVTGNQISRETWISILRLDKDSISQMGFTSQAYMNKARNVALDNAFSKHNNLHVLIPTPKSILYPMIIKEFEREDPMFGWCGDVVYMNVDALMRLPDPFFRYTPLEGSIEEYAKRVRKHGFSALEIPYKENKYDIDENGIISLKSFGGPVKKPGVSLLMVASWPTVHILFCMANITLGMDNVSSIYISIKDHGGAADMPLARNQLVRKAIDEDPDSDYVFFHDIDMQVGTDTIPYLLAQDKPVIGAVYYQRGDPYYPHTMRMYGQTRLRRIVDFPTEPNNPFRVDAQGTGALLIHKDVFKTVPYPWFAFDKLGEEDMLMGEDYWFSWACKQAGVETWADGSVPTTHITDIPVDAKIAHQCKAKWRE